MRLFFAVTLPEHIAEHVLEAQQAMRSIAGEEGISWTRPEQFHFTIAFLGELPVARAQKAVECAHAVREGREPFELTLGRLGAFPNADRPTALWLGAAAGAGNLSDMAARLEGLLVNQAHPREKRTLKAHITLGRVKMYKGEMMAARALRKLAEDERWSDIGTFTVDRFVLMHSVLKSAGSEYTIVDEFLFGS